MNSIPAKVAGVGELIMVVPAPDEQLNPLVLAAAAIAGVDKLYTIGGAQAVAALAYGTDTVPAVDKIVGPGNIYVATAKREVFGKVGGFFAEFDNSTNSTGFGPFTIDGSGSDDGDTSFTGGVGFRFEVTDHVHVRADWDRYINVGAERDIDSFTGGLEFAF